MRLKLIGCHVLSREVCDAIVHCPHRVDPEFLPAGLHCDGSKKMRARVQQAIDGAEGGGYDAVLLCYALCGGGLAGVVARDTRLVLPRGHDCITLLMGGRDQYSDCFTHNSGVFYRTTGWLEHGDEMTEQYLGQADEGDLDTLIERYGEDAGRYLYEELTAYRRLYTGLTFISSGLEPDGSFLASARQEAATKGWTFSCIEGDLRLFKRLLAGDWADDFLVVPPGHKIVATYDQAIVAAVPVAGG